MRKEGKRPIFDLMRDLSSLMYDFMPVGPKSKKIIVDCFDKQLKEVSANGGPTLNINSIDEDGQNMGHHFAREHVVGALKAFYLKGGDLHATDHHGNTLFHCLCECAPFIFDGTSEYKLCINFLLQQKLDINHTNNNGQTPLFHIIASMKNEKFFADRMDQSQCTQVEQFIEEMIKNGADIHHQSNNNKVFSDGIKHLPEELKPVFMNYTALIQRQSLLHAVGDRGQEQAKRKM